jgi:uncharacterized protein (TIGR03000 family)
MKRWLMTGAVMVASLLALTPQRSLAQAAAPGRVAHVRLDLPRANAELWFNGVRMQGQGTTRTFTTPPLTAGQDYHYVVRARWMQNGMLVDSFRNLPVTAGQDAVMDFRPGAGQRSAYMAVSTGPEGQAGLAETGGTTYVFVPVLIPQSMPRYAAPAQPAAHRFWQDWAPSP